MRKFEGLKIVRGLILALSVAGVACTQNVGVSERAEATATSQAALPVPIAEENKMTCVLCFGEEGGGGGGSGSIGMDIFMGAMFEWDYVSGAASPVVVAQRTGDSRPCPPDTECVKVTGEPRDRDDTRIWVTITGSLDFQQVNIPLPEGRPAPTRIVPLPKPCSQVQGEVICLDLLRACLAAVVSKEAWEEFCQLIAKDDWRLAERLRHEGFMFSPTKRTNLCNRFFGT